jgi:hypothetical protein
MHLSAMGLHFGALGNQLEVGLCLFWLLKNFNWTRGLGWSSTNTWILF